MRYTHGLSKGLFRLISVVLLSALVLSFVGIGVVRAGDPAWTQTSRADFEAGTLVNLDTTSSPGDVMLALDPSSQQLDQNNPNHSNNWHEVKDKKWCAQTFVAGLTGDLTKVALYLKKSGSPGGLTIEIRDCAGATSPPGSTILASMTTSAVTSTTGQEYQFIFPSPASVTTGTYYAIVLHEPEGAGVKGINTIGLSINQVTYIRQERSGGAMIAGGAGRWEEVVFTIFTSGHGLPLDITHRAH